MAKLATAIRDLEIALNEVGTVHAALVAAGRVGVVVDAAERGLDRVAAAHAALREHELEHAQLTDQLRELRSTADAANGNRLDSVPIG